MGKKEKAEKKERPLDKMTAKELRELALTIPDIVGVHGMNKEEIIRAIREARGIKEDKDVKTESSVRDLKKKIKELKSRRAEALETNEVKKATILRRRVSRLKKRTRKSA